VKEMKMVKILPEEPVTRDTRPVLRRREVTQETPERFGLLVSGDKALDMDALTQRIKRKGSASFQRALTEVFAEVPEGCENGVLLTHAQVARMFGVTGMTVYDWRKRFALPSFQLKGGRKPPVRYDEGALLKWAEMYGKKVMHEDYHDWC
jgi:hypothetical protein